MNEGIALCLWLSLWTAVGEMLDRGQLICSSYGHKLVVAKFNAEEHLLCLKLRAIGTLPLMKRDTALILYPDPEDDSENKLSLPDAAMVYGFPVENPAAGSAEGYIGDDNHFYGVLHYGSRTLHADPYGIDDPSRSFGSLDHDQIPSRPRRHHDQFRFLEHLPFHVEDQKRSASVAHGRVCELLLLADHEFFIKDANSSLSHAVRRMLHAVEQADVIFRNADFDEDGTPDNIGFIIKYIIVLQSEETNVRTFGHLVQTSRGVDGKDYLMRFARLRRLSDVCLGVAFSGHAFHNRTLGLSFTSLGGGIGGSAGGLCDRRAYGRSFNTLAIAHATAEDDQRVPERIAAMTLAHELGHSFGAHHDENFPEPQCQGYLMGSQSASNGGSHCEFSVCSKRLIAATLGGMSYCLVEDDQPFCGNGIVEEGEACDCGLPSRCSLMDPCCTPRAGGATAFDEGALHREGCSVAPAAACHPSQGLCCSADCQYADLSRSGIDCKAQEQDCNYMNMSSASRCGLGGRCLPDGSCHAAECAILGLRECQCPKKGPGGSVGMMEMCGVCCQLERAEDNSSTCLGAEFAALRALKTDRISDEWPDPDYSGPNITLHLCKGYRCITKQMRAWPIDSYCVTRNTVGVCLPNGRCRRSYHSPRSNIFPRILSTKHSKNSKYRETSTKKILLHLFVIFLLTFVH